MGAGQDFLDRRLEDLLDDIAERSASPAGGSVLAIVVAMAAGLVAMAARFSTERWERAGAIAARAETLRERASPLAQRDADSYARVFEAYRLPGDRDATARAEAIATALGNAATVPLETAAIAAELAQLAVEVVEHGNPTLRGDAAAAAALAEASARAATTLVAIDLASTPDDERIVRARALSAAASEAASRALELAS